MYVIIHLFMRNSDYQIDYGELCRLTHSYFPSRERGMKRQSISWLVPITNNTMREAIRRYQVESTISAPKEIS